MQVSRFLSIFSVALLATINLRAATPIPFNYRDGMIWLKIAVAGKKEPLNFVLDSGAGTSILDLATARRLGLKIDQPETVQGASGRALAYHVRGFCGEAANVPITSSLLAVDLSAPSRCCHQHIDGLLGADFFLNRIVQIGYASETIRLLQRSEVNPSGSEILPLKKCNDCFSVYASIGGSAPALLRLDTGCCTALEWVVTGDKARKLGSTTIGLNSGSMHEFYTDVQMGTTRLSAVKTGVHTSQMFAGESGLIGNGLLSRFTITFDIAKSRCLLASH